MVIQSCRGSVFAGYEEATEIVGALVYCMKSACRRAAATVGQYLMILQ